MPGKAVVAFGIVLALGLLTFSAPAWCSDANGSGPAISRLLDTVPEIANEQIAEPTAPLPVLTLDQVLTRTLKLSPTLAAFSREIEAREFEARQAGLRPNPELSVEVEDIAGSGDLTGIRSAETTLLVSQLFELGDKRALRRDVGNLARELASREYQLVLAEVLADATERYIAVLAAQQRLSLAAEQFELTERVSKAVADRIAAGKTPAVQGVRFQTLAVEARLRKERVGRELTAALRALASVWGSEAVDFHSVKGQFESVSPLPDWQELASRLDRSPQEDVRKSASRLADRALALERANGIPDLTFKLGARNHQESGDNALVAEISMPLQVFNRNRGAIAAARARKARADDEARAVQLQLRTALAAGLQKLQSAHREVAVLLEEILPATQKTFDAVVYGYEAGKFGFLDVLDAERTLFEAKDRYVESLSAYHQATSELERVLGQKLFIGGELSAPAEKG